MTHKKDKKYVFFRYYGALRKFNQNSERSLFLLIAKAF